MPNNNCIDSDNVLFISEKERKKLRRFASKITKIPDTIRVYADPLMEKRESRGEREDG